MNILGPLILGILFGLIVKWKFIEEQYSNKVRSVLFLINLLSFNLIPSSNLKSLVLNFIFGVIAGTFLSKKKDGFN